MTFRLLVWMLLPMSYRRLVGAKAIKLGSWDKHPQHTARIKMSMSGICAMKGKCDMQLLVRNK